MSSFVAPSRERGSKRPMACARRARRSSLLHGSVDRNAGDEVARDLLTPSLLHGSVDRNMLGVALAPLPPMSLPHGGVDRNPDGYGDMAVALGRSLTGAWIETRRCRRSTDGTRSLPHGARSECRFAALASAGRSSRPPPLPPDVSRETSGGPAETAAIPVSRETPRPYLPMQKVRNKASSTSSTSTRPTTVSRARADRRRCSARRSSPPAPMASAASSSMSAAARA